MANKFGPERAAMMQSRLIAMGQAEGIDFTGRGKVGNTRDAHRLVQLAKTKSNVLENKVVAELFTSYFEEGGDITSHDMLIAAAEKAGLDKSETKQWLEQGKGGTEVDQEVEEAYRHGVSGVPNFTINDQYEVSGAQDPQTLLQQFVRVKKSVSGVNTSSDGVSC